VTDLATADRLRALAAALAAEPERADLHFERATVLLHSGDGPGALVAYAEAARLRPGWLAPRLNRGIVLQRLQRHAEARAALEEALQLAPGSEAVLTPLAAVTHALGRPGEAAELARRAAAADPSRPEPWINLAVALHALGRLPEAEAASRQALQRDPRAAVAEYNLAHALHDQWRGPEALASFRRAVELDPAYEPARHALLFNLLYDAGETEASLYAAHAAWGRNVEERLAASPPPPPAAGARRLRIGYLSPDFRAHSCAHFLQPLYAAHDRGRVELFSYSAVARPDAVTAWFQSHSDHWFDLRGLDEPAIAERIRADGLHVLVDLAGHTRGQPLGVFARRPAAVQVAWLGYPATSGLTAIGYRLTDAIADPPGDADRWHTEKLVRLAGGLHCYAAPADTPAVTPPPVARRGHVTFGSFNNVSKVTDDVVRTWTRVLAAVPGSRLVLKGQMLASEAARLRVEQAFAAAGLAPGRLELRPWITGGTHPLAAHGDIDIALDTFPYNGTTTTFEALWMGVPVVTQRGARHAARVGASILTHLGRDAWIAAGTDEYVATAVRLAGDPGELARLRGTLRGALQVSSLCDAAGFAARIEDAFRRLVALSALA
jgi:predicted O-linked N-acetylglucosamine transferase (SPINDLY family)